MQGTILQNRFYKPNENTVSVLSDGKVKIFYWRLWYKLWKLIISMQWQALLMWRLSLLSLQVQHQYFPYGKPD